MQAGHTEGKKKRLPRLQQVSAHTSPAPPQKAAAPYLDLSLAGSTEVDLDKIHCHLPTNSSLRGSCSGSAPTRGAVMSMITLIASLPPPGAATPRGEEPD